MKRIAAAWIIIVSRSRAGRGDGNGVLCPSQPPPGISMVVKLPLGKRMKPAPPARSPAITPEGLMTRTSVLPAEPRASMVVKAPF